MPIYEYRCRVCNTKFTSFFRSMAEAEHERVTCSACGASDVHRLISRVAVIGEASPAEEEASSEPEKPTVFGRKELEEIMRQREQWAQEVEAEQSSV